MAAKTPTREMVIQTEGMTKSFGDVHAVQDLDLSVPRHAIFGFLGPNGAGKTTTMKLLLGLLRPTSGRATILGHDAREESMQIRARIGYLPQQPRFYEHMTARETLRFTARFFFTGPKAALETHIDEMLDLVGLTAKADRTVKGFSGGERQRLGLAQAQINDPELLILDEPAAALDPIGRADVLNLMTRLRQRTTIFYSTHILDDVQHVSDTVAILNQGNLVAQGPINQFLAGSDTVVYEITTKGDGHRIQSHLLSQPWVATVDTLAGNGETTWQVAVTDETAAETQLLPALVNSAGLIVTAFNRKKYELEEIFMSIIDEENNGSN